MALSMDRIKWIFLAIIILATSCAINPVTKKHQLMLVSEEEEFKTGRQVDKQVREEMGIYLELPKLRELVKRVESNIGKNSDRPNLIYRAEIVDTPDFNAFALPGGFIYVHRGLLARINSIDELAAVLAHETTHVAARHSASQMSKQKAMNILLFGVNIATRGVVQNYGQFINLAAVLAFNKFSRNYEKQADHCGLIYMTRSGYNPLAFVSVLKQIKRLEAREPSVFEVWFMTHPPANERIMLAKEELKQIKKNCPECFKRPIRRNEYIALLDGLAMGERTPNELVLGDKYYNKEYCFSVKIPLGWYIRLRSKYATAIFLNSKKQFSAFLNVEPLMKRTDNATYHKQKKKALLRHGLVKVADLKKANLPYGAKASIFTGADKTRGNIKAELISFVRKENGYYILGSSKERDFSQLHNDIMEMINGWTFLKPEEAMKLQPLRLKIHRVKRGETWRSITIKYYGSDIGAVRLAEFNGFDKGEEPPPGILIKIPPSLRFY